MLFGLGLACLVWFGVYCVGVTVDVFALSDEFCFD